MLANAFAFAFTRFQDRNYFTTQVEALASRMEANAQFRDVLENKSLEKVSPESIFAIMLLETRKIVRSAFAGYSSREK